MNNSILWINGMDAMDYCYGLQCADIMDKFVEFLSSLHGYTDRSSRRIIQAQGSQMCRKLVF